MHIPTPHTPIRDILILKQQKSLSAGVMVIWLFVTEWTFFDCIETVLSSSDYKNSWKFYCQIGPLFICIRDMVMCLTVDIIIKICRNGTEEWHYYIYFQHFKVSHLLFLGTKNITPAKTLIKALRQCQSHLSVLFVSVRFMMNLDENNNKREDRLCLVWLC